MKSDGLMVPGATGAVVNAGFGEVPTETKKQKKEVFVFCLGRIYQSFVKEKHADYSNWV